MKYGAFISYCHEDADNIVEVIKLIKAMRNDLVFQDKQDLKAGQLWEPQINKALNDAKVVIVFWCSHSAQSKYVKKEYEFAISNNKQILPLLLDKTKLANSLKAYQWIDFSAIYLHINKTNAPINKPNKKTPKDIALLDEDGYDTSEGLGGVSKGYGHSHKRRTNPGNDYDGADNNYNASDDDYLEVRPSPLNTINSGGRLHMQMAQQVIDELNKMIPKKK